MIVVLAVSLIIGIVVWAIISEKKKDAGRRDKAMMRGWRYESARGNRQGFSVEGFGGSLTWRLEERRSGGKNDQRPLYFLCRDLRYDQGIFLFGDKREVGVLQKPFMQYILKLGAKMAKGPESQRMEALTHLGEAQTVEIPDSGGKWNYEALATRPEFAMKVLGAGLQAEYDALSQQKLGAYYAPSVMLSGEGMEIKWGSRSVDAEKMEIIIDSSVRVMGILSQAVRG